MMTYTHGTRHSIIFIITLGILLLLWQTQAFAEPQKVGQIAWVKGTVTATLPGAQPRPLSRRSVIYANDTIQTSAGATGQIVFTDTSIVSLSANTRVEVNKYQFRNTTGQKEKYILTITKGGLRTITGIIAKDNPDGYTINTPAATIGVRGTAFSVIVSDSGGVAVGVQTGRVIVSNEKGSAIIGPELDKAYAMISGLHSAPVTTSQPPKVFETNPLPQITPEKFQGNPGRPTPGIANSICVS